jgi:hypothetical protein
MFRGSNHGGAAMVLLLLVSSVAHGSGPETIRTTRVGFGRHAPRPDTSGVDIVFTTAMPQEKFRKIGRVEFTPAYYRDLDRRIREGKLVFTPSIRNRFEGLASPERVFIVARAMINAKLASRKDPMTQRRARADSLATQREWLDDSSRVAVELRRQVLQCMQEMEDALGEARQMGGETLLINDDDTPKVKTLDPLERSLLDPTFNGGMLLGDQQAPFLQGMPVFDAWVVVRK